MIFRVLLVFFFSLTGSGLCQPNNLEIGNLVAWCIVPFDSEKRTPGERAAMLKKLGLRRCAYDWREKHIPEFEEEILQYKKHGIEFFAFWGEHPEAFRLFEKHQIHPQIWKMFPEPSGGTYQEKVAGAVKFLTPLAQRTSKMKCKLALYNHGGWSGKPANLVAVCKGLRALGHKHVGIVYNWHHGHDRIDHWKNDLALMKTYLFCLNLNGMKANANPKILPLGKGEFEKPMLKLMRESGYEGPIGILDHRNELDSKLALNANLEGLIKIMK